MRREREEEGLPDVGDASEQREGEVALGAHLLHVRLEHAIHTAGSKGEDE